MFTLNDYFLKLKKKNSHSFERTDFLPKGQVEYK